MWVFEPATLQGLNDLLRDRSLTFLITRSRKIHALIRCFVWFSFASRSLIFHSTHGNLVFLTLYSKYRTRKRNHDLFCFIADFLDLSFLFHTLTKHSKNTNVKFQVLFKNLLVHYKSKYFSLNKNVFLLLCFCYFIYSLDKIIKLAILKFQCNKKKRKKDICKSVKRKVKNFSINLMNYFYRESNNG